MVQTAVTFYDVVLWLHVSAVVVGFGPPFAYGIWIALASRDDPESIPFVYRVLQRLDRSFVTIGGIVILLTGMYMAADAWDFGYFFITWGLIAVLVLLGLLHGFFIPNERRAERLARRDIEATTSGRAEFSREYGEVSGRLARIGPIAGLIVIVTIYVMVAKPFL